ncbi:hypothetical protein V5799_021651 [Amblyomma americanum]|uniref:Uncharacterized protein n=1 Tax=Amblyomma americanum TaxID=6943 RepID=A0AAQ4FPC5_AMBAM
MNAVHSWRKHDGSLEGEAREGGGNILLDIVYSNAFVTKSERSEPQPRHERSEETAESPLEAAGGGQKCRT